MIFSKIKPKENFQNKLGLKKNKKPRLTKTDRWLIVGILLFTTATSLFFYFKERILSFPSKITAPLVITGGPTPKGFDPSPILKKIKETLVDAQGTYGVYVYRFGDNQEYGINYQEVFPAASLMKLPVILTLYREAEAGRIDLETKYLLKNEDKRLGAGILQGKPAGSVYTYRQLAEFMGQYSDNTANNVLVKILGVKKIQETIGDLGLKKTDFSKYETTPEDMGIFFKKLYKGSFINQTHREEILRFLTQTAFEDRIPAGLPSGVRVAHKVGTEIGVFADAGIVFPSVSGGEPSEPFILVIMSKEAKEKEAKEIIPKITKIIWEEGQFF